LNFTFRFLAAQNKSGAPWQMIDSHIDLEKNAPCDGLYSTTPLLSPVSLS
jgi:hypothetical protein